MPFHRTKGALTLAAAAALTAGALAGAQEPSRSEPPVVLSADRAIQELIDINAKLAAENQRLAGENQRLAAEVARMKLDMTRLLKERDDLSQFIQDHEAYGDNYEQYTFFREKADREARARQAAEAQSRRDADKLRQQQEREDRLRQRGGGTEPQDDSVLSRRVETLKRAGYTRVGERVFVGEMGYSYRTETREEIRYSPLIDFWYVDRDEEVLYNEMTVSGSLIHAGNEERNVSIVFAFFDASGAQIGTTTVRVDGARPGTPYPFTSVVTMAGNGPFKRYSSWVLYDDPAVPPATDEQRSAPAMPPADRPSDG